MTVKKNTVPNTLKATSASISIPPKQGIRTAWILWWDSWKALMSGRWVTFYMHYEPKKESIHCNNQWHQGQYYSCSYENPSCVWSV